MENYKINFGQWLRSKYGRLYLIASTILGILYSFTSYLKILNFDFKLNIEFLKSNTTFTDIFPFFIQIVFILFVVLINAIKYYEFESVSTSTHNEKNIWANLRIHKHEEIKPADDIEKEVRWIKYKADSNKSAEQFVYFWFFCWVTWLAFYIVLTINQFDNATVPPGVLNLLNNINALFFIFLFATLSTSTADLKYLSWSRFGVIILLVFVIELIFNKQGNNNTNYLFSLISGLFNGLAMASFIGSINSRTITIPLWVLLLLTLYPAIQPLYFIFVNKEIFSNNYQELLKDTQSIILIIVFFLKVLLFLLVTWILQTGRLMHFMVQEGSLNYDKKNQFNIFVDNAKLKLRRLL